MLLVGVEPTSPASGLAGPKDIYAHYLSTPQQQKVELGVEPRSCIVRNAPDVPRSKI